MFYKTFGFTELIIDYGISFLQPLIEDTKQLLRGNIDQSQK